MLTQLFKLAEASGPVGAQEIQKRHCQTRVKLAQRLRWLKYVISKRLRLLIYRGEANAAATLRAQYNISTNTIAESPLGRKQPAYRRIN